MPTLDDVIRAIEECRDSYVAGKIIKSGALHYLKEYRDYRNANKTVTENRSVSEAENKPLTWDELKQMEGKPVFVEERYRNGDLKLSGWWLIDFWNDDQICLRDQGGNPWNAHRKSIGRDWQAYRKERE